MHPDPIMTAELLTAWEQGLSQSPSRRALTLLAAAFRDMPEDKLVRLCVGQRDRLLMGLRETLFGSQLTSLSACPVCAERLELKLDIADIKIASESEPASELSLELTGYQVNFRLPDSQDLMLIEACTDLPEARYLLFERCLLSVERDGQEQSAAGLPDDILNRIETAMSDADPQADVQLNLTCPACGYHWLATFDIASFLWSEINAWAQRILNEVHSLAKAYGWREAEILSMSSKRRHLYLALVAETRGA